MIYLQFVNLYGILKLLYYMTCINYYKLHNNDNDDKSDLKVRISLCKTFNFRNILFII